MATELAREIIDQSKPRDRSSLVCIKIHSPYSEHLSITAPIIDGVLVVRIEFKQVVGMADGYTYTLQYDARNILEGAAMAVEGVVRHRIGINNSHAVMHGFDKNGRLTPELTRWSYKDLNGGTVMDNTLRILKTLFAV